MLSGFFYFLKINFDLPKYIFYICIKIDSLADRAGHLLLQRFSFTTASP